MKLTVKQIDSSKPKEKDYKLSDGGGLYLLVKTNGEKYWRLKYRIDGKEKLLAIGIYPTVTLADARRKRDDAKRLLADGIDPNQQRKEQKQASKIDSVNTFKNIALEWYEGVHSPLSETALIRVFQLLPINLRRKIIQTFMCPVLVIILHPEPGHFFYLTQ